MTNKEDEIRKSFECSPLFASCMFKLEGISDEQRQIVATHLFAAYMYGRERHNRDMHMFTFESMADYPAWMDVIDELNDKPL